MSTKTAENLLYLFERPTEPVFMPKGKENVVFEVPSEYIVERYRPLQNELETRFGSGEVIKVKQIRLPDISFAMQLGRRENFSLFIPLHRQMAGRLIEVFMGMRNLDDFLSATVYARDRVNPYLFNYAFSVALLHRPDTHHLEIPSLPSVFPDKFMDGEVFNKAKEEVAIVDSDDARIPITIPKDYSASNFEEEHRVAYFREDLGINLHHWHWHLVYPFTGERNIVAKDRRGELFYYMHQQIMARYNLERFSNDLGRVKRLTNFRDIIPEGYFPKMDNLVSSRIWPARKANTQIQDIDREIDQLRFDVIDMEHWRDTIYSAINQGFVLDTQGKRIDLTEKEGIDILGNIVEASILTPNLNLYGDLHNFGHVALSFIHDPEGKHLESFSPVGDPSTTMRDPAFYRWHAFTNDLFVRHKNTLPAYPRNQLDWSGVRVTSCELVQTEGQAPKNQINTFWQQSDVDMTRGLDFTPRGSVYARFTHLQHAGFTYRIVVESNQAKMATVRIWLGPQFDERGLPMVFNDHRQLMLELDKYTVKLKNGKQTLERRSTQSNLTIPFERTFRDLTRNRPAEGSQAIEEFNFCGCGWPQHMLVPKGNVQGYPCVLFVQITNYDDDKVDTGGAENKRCGDAALFCGLRDAKYPEGRSMGYPFDRIPRMGVATMQQFLTPNMAVQNVTIKFTDRTVTPTTVGGQ